MINRNIYALIKHPVLTDRAMINTPVVLNNELSLSFEKHQRCANQ